ncbi:MAG TPA: TRCF domain-containing protein, partial [Bacteroidota bacterium]|nr:TRCF domain-containing protein [Bacteroidota bacterium]
GKTEVAVRAAFKAVMDGKQVAVLVPTTILAIQHYNTFQDRLSRYATRIEHITRFRSPKDQKNIIGQLTAGSVDIVIGTHRLLSKDIAFKDIGLLIIDEEHRFGVSAKEKLRQLKANVDTLALTATPIPRTLHFSLIGARDLSLIETAPRNRLPIITEIIAGDTGERQWDIVREAIINELHRGGQAYVVHDRVQNIEAIADQVRTRVPHARVHIAHGQMSGHELEKTMIDFLEKKYDVLVCTKIIESGVDIPNVNTIIINRADRFGLAELYQLRGRVGRSNIQAYAYLLTPPLRIMPKQTLRRLQAIEEFTELGSGFNLAMRDLEIRGAGNLLGAEQSGFIMEMGFEMYERIVREAVDELRQEEFGKTLQTDTPEKRAAHRMTETIFETDIQAMIPDVYIESDAERLDIYRRLSRTSSPLELQTIREELRDRFGEYPEEVDHLVRLLEIRFIASALELSKVSCHGDSLTVTLPPASNISFYGEYANTDSPFQKMMMHIAEQPKRSIQLKQDGELLTLRFVLPHQMVIRDRIDYLKKSIEELQRWMS